MLPFLEGGASGCPLPADDGTQRKELQRKEASKSTGRADVSEVVLLPIMFWGGFKVTLEPLVCPNKWPGRAEERILEKAKQKKG